MNRFVFAIACIAFGLIVTHNARSQARVYRQVSNETLEKVLQSLNVKYQKGERKDKDSTTTYFDFTRGDTTFRLYNYVSDLWIETTIEKKVKADDVNRWNADAKFSRVVMIETKEKTVVSLESQLDCLGGTTDALIKQYINRFDDEAKKFAKFVK